MQEADPGLGMREDDVETEAPLGGRGRVEEWGSTYQPTGLDDRRHEWISDGESSAMAME